MQPFGQVSALEDGDLKLFGTLVIVLLLFGLGRKTLTYLNQFPFSHS